MPRTHKKDVFFFFLVNPIIRDTNLVVYVQHVPISNKQNSAEGDLNVQLICYIDMCQQVKTWC